MRLLHRLYTRRNMIAFHLYFLEFSIASRKISAVRLLSKLRTVSFPRSFIQDPATFNTHSEQSLSDIMYNLTYNPSQSFNLTYTSVQYCVVHLSTLLRISEISEVLYFVHYKSIVLLCKVISRMAHDLLFNPD